MDVEVASTSSGYHAPKEVTDLAERLAAQHQCKITISMEESGYHIYLPCPKCLETHGRKELAEPKYAINASKYLSIGEKFRKRSAFEDMLSEDFRDGNEKRDRGSSICMRTRSSKEPHRFSVSELLSMSSIPTRHPDIYTRASLAGVAKGNKEEHWEVDPLTGVLSPPLPGVCTPIIALPDDHPAVRYITDRGFSPGALYRQFGCEYCVQEYPEGKNDIFYKRMPAGWKDTPQGRIILYSITDKQRVTWQARVIERVSPCGLTRQMWHPYRDTWCDVAIRPSRDNAWIPKAPYDERDQTGNLKFSPSKYRTAKYSSREVMGWDAAMSAKHRWDEELSMCVLVEGPMDAARVGPGGIAVLGSSLSLHRAEKMARNFRVIITAFDNDKAGQEATAKITRQLMSDEFGTVSQIIAVEKMEIPTGKDLGDMPQKDFEQIMQSTVRKIRRRI